MPITPLAGHILASGRPEDRVPALRSQYPMLSLIVGYTVVSLWAIAQPIVEMGAGA